MPRPIKKKGEVSKLLLNIKKSSISAAVKELLVEKVKNGGRIPSGCMVLVLNDLEKSGVVTNRDHLNYQLAKLEAKIENEMLEEKRKKEMESRTMLLPIDVVHCDAGEEMTVSDITGSSTSHSNGSKQRGRPAGSSTVNRMKNQSVRLQCISEIATTYKNELTECKKNNCITSKCYLKKLIKRKWEEFELDSATIVSSETIRSRVKRGNLYAAHAGTPPVLPDIIEKVIVDVVLMMAKIRNPLCVSQIIELANSMIMKSEFKEKIKEWKALRYNNLPEKKEMTLGYGWWRGFNRRYEDVLVVKHGERFASDRAEWSKEIYIRQMYEVIYKNMVNAKIAKKLPSKVFFNSYGGLAPNPTNILCNTFNYDDDNMPLGLASEYEMIHPENLLL